jgi:TraB/PrgY/gumN family
MKLSSHLAAATAVLGLTVGLAPAAESTAPLEELETILVLGEQPGPGLWKVSKGDHVLWILASHAPLPKGMSWRSQQVEARIAASQEVLLTGRINIGANIGLLRGLTLLPAALKAGKIPDGGTLKDVLSAETYGKWLVLRQKYVGKDDDIEKWRPAFALEQLRAAAFRKGGMERGMNVYEVIERAAKKHKVRQHRLPDIKRTLKVENPRGMLKSAQKMELSDIACFTRSLDQVEPGVERAKLLANAWSRGDIDKLRNLHRNPLSREALRDNCAYALMTEFNAGSNADAANARKALADAEWHAELARVQMMQEWVAAAQAALTKNTSTFAALPVDEMFRPDGPIEKLRALGYVVNDPS